MADYPLKQEAAEVQDILDGAFLSNKGQNFSEETKAFMREKIGASAAGEGLKIISHFDSVEELQATVTAPTAGDAYSVGTELPYNLYIFDFLNGVWKNYGPIRANDLKARFAQNIPVPVSAWSEDASVFPDYTFKARIALAEVTGNDFPIVGFAPSDAISGNYCPIAYCFDGFVEIWAKAIPAGAITVPAATFIVQDTADAVTGNSTKGITNASGGIATGGIGTNQIANGAVTAPKLSPSAVSKVFPIVVGTEWTGDTEPYSQTIGVEGLPDTNRIFSALILSADWETSKAERAESEKITSFTRVENQEAIIVRATEPTTMPLNFNIFVLHGSGTGAGDDDETGGDGGEEGGSTGGGTGADGFSPIAYVVQTETGATISITDKNGTTTAEVLNGKDGVDGSDGYTPVKGVDYFDGQDGSPGKDGNGIKSAVLNADYTLTLAFDDGTSYTTPSIRGATGSPGKDGAAGAPGQDGAAGVGIASIEQTTTSTADDGNNVFTVTLTNGTSATFTVQNGSKGSAGADGAAGKDGTSVTVKSVSESSADGGDNVVTFSDGKTLTVKNGSKGSKGDTGDTGETGATGERGNSILNITTAPSSYTTATGGFTPVYRIALSTVLTQSKASKVLVGDSLRYSYYLYPVGYVDESYVYLGARVSIRGATGATPDSATILETVIAELGTLTITGVDSAGTTHTWTVYAPVSDAPVD